VDSALPFIASGAALGFIIAVRRQGATLGTTVRLLPALCASALLACCFAWLIWPVLPLVWQAKAYHEAVGGFVASLLPALVGGLADPYAPAFQQFRVTAWIGCAFVGLCFVGYPFLVNLIGAIAFI
jgi:hypothetical protein